MTTLEVISYILDHWQGLSLVVTSAVTAASACDAMIKKPTEDTEQSATKAILVVVKNLLSFVALNVLHAKNKE